MSNSVVINILAKVAGTQAVETLKTKLTNLTTAKSFQSVVMGVGMGAGMAAWNALGNAARGAGDVLADSIGIASDLSESMNKANVVFGSSATAIDDFAKTSATSFGISKRAAYEATGTFGNLFTSMGLGKEAAASMSVDLAKLAADLASFNNIGIEDALQKLRSGLVGESEPMRQLGVNINEAAVNAKALTLGFSAVNGKFSEAAKIQARYALIVEQSSNASNDFAETSDGLANSQKILAAQVEDLQAAIGEKLLPVMKDFVNYANQDLVPALGDAVGAMSHLSWAMQYQRDNAQDLWFWQKGLLGLWTDGSQSAEAYADAMEELANQEKASAAWTARLAGQAEALANSVGSVGNAAALTEEELADLERRSKSLWDTFIEGTRAATQDEKLELQKLPIQIREAQRDVRDAQKELEKARTKEQKDEARIRLIEAKQEVVRLQADLTALKGKFAAAGKTLGYSLGSSLHAEVVRWNNKTRAELRRLGDDVSNVGPGTNSSTIKPRALGGTVWEDQTYLVGERGPELFVPSTTGTIVPNATGGGNVAVAVYLDSDQIAARVERRQYFAASVAPASAR